jgi:hypothetical protein
VGSLLAFLGWRFAAWNGDATAEIAATWQAETTWKGTFRFRPPMQEYVGDVTIVVTHREGNQFSGTYATENGAYLWEIAGRVARDEAGESIEWHVVRAVLELEPRPSMRAARATGVLRDNLCQQVLRIPDGSDPNGESIADLTLRLEDALPAGAPTERAPLVAGGRRHRKRQGAARGTIWKTTRA